MRLPPSHASTSASDSGAKNAGGVNTAPAYIGVRSRVPACTPWMGRSSATGRLCRQIRTRSPFPAAFDRFHGRIQVESKRRLPQEVLVATFGALVVRRVLRAG